MYDVRHLEFRSSSGFRRSGLSFHNHPSADLRESGQGHCRNFSSVAQFGLYRAFGVLGSVGFIGLWVSRAFRLLGLEGLGFRA